MEETLQQRLQRFTAGMTYPSETDAPFEVFTWPATNGTSRGAVQAQTKATAIGEQTIDAFFGELAADEQAPKFGALQRLLVEQLTDLHVFRVGDGSTIDVYVLGRGKNGEWVGVRTASVET